MDDAKGKSRLWGRGERWGEKEKYWKIRKQGDVPTVQSYSVTEGKKTFFSGCFGAFSGLGMTYRSS